MKNSKYMSFDFDLINGNPMNRIDYPYLEIIDFQNKLKDSNFPLYCGKEISPNASVGKMPTYFDDNGTVYCVRSENLKNGKVDLKSVQKKTNLDTYKNEPIGSKLGKGDFLMVSAGSCGKFAIYDENEKCLTNEAITHLDINTSIVNKEFLLLCVNSNVIQEQINKMKTTAAIPNFKYQHFKKLIFPIMSLEEQERTLPLVKAKIKILEDKIKELEEEKKRYELQNKIDEVFSNELGIDKPNNMLDRFYSFKNSIISANTFDESGTLDVFTKLRFPMLESLKSKFKCVKLKEITSCVMPGRDTPKPTEDKTFLFRVQTKDMDEKTGKVNYKNLDCLKENDFNNFIEKKIQKNDILIAIFGSGAIGRIVLFDNDEINAVLGNHLVGVIRTNEEIDYKFLFYYLYSFLGQQQIFKCITGTTGQISLSIPRVKKILVPILDKNTQQEIIDKIENYGSPFELDLQIEQLQSIIDDDLNKYILNGYSDDLFEMPKGE